MNELVNLIFDFLDERIDGVDFVDKYIDGWRLLGKTNQVLTINQDVSEVLSTIFCLADMFNPSEDREDYEFDEAKLRIEIKKVIRCFLLKVIYVE